MPSERQRILERLKDARRSFLRLPTDRFNHVVIDENHLNQISPAEIPEGVLLCVGGSEEDELASMLLYKWGYFFIENGELFGLCLIPSEYNIIWDRVLAFEHYVDLVRRQVEFRAREQPDIEIVPPRMREVAGVWTVSPTEPVVQFRVRCTSKTLSQAYCECRRIYEETIVKAEEAVAETEKIVNCLSSAMTQLEDWNLSELLQRVDSSDSNEKGQALEELICRLFASIAGLTVSGRTRTVTEEIDIWIVNDSTDPRLSREGAVILVECKNWSSKCGRPEFSLLREKMLNRATRCTLAFLVSWNGFTESVQAEMLRSSREHLLIVPITGRQVQQAIVNGTFSSLIFEAWDSSVFT